MTVTTPICRKALSKPWKERSTSQMCKLNDSCAANENSKLVASGASVASGALAGAYSVGIIKSVRNRREQAILSKKERTRHSFVGLG